MKRWMRLLFTFLVVFSFDLQAVSELRGRVLGQGIVTDPGKTIRLRLWLSCPSVGDVSYSFDTALPENWRVLQQPEYIPPGPFHGRIETVFIYVPRDTKKGHYPIVCSLYAEGIRCLDVPVSVEVLEQASLITSLGFVPFHCDPEEVFHFSFSINNTGNTDQTIAVHNYATAIRQETRFSPHVCELAPGQSQEVCVEIMFGESVIVARTFVITIYLQDRITGKILTTFLVTTNLIPGSGVAPVPPDNVIPSILTVELDVERARSISLVNLSGTGQIASNMSSRYEFVGSGEWGNASSLQANRFSFELFNAQASLVAGDGDHLGQGLQLLPAQGRGFHAEYSGIPRWLVRGGMWKPAILPTVEPPYIWTGVRSTYREGSNKIIFSLMEKLYTDNKINGKHKPHKHLSLLGIAVQCRCRRMQFSGELANSLRPDAEPNAFCLRASGAVQGPWGINGNALYFLKNKAFPLQSKHIVHFESQLDWGDQTTTFSARKLWDFQLEQGEGLFAGQNFQNQLSVIAFEGIHRLDRNRMMVGASLCHEKRYVEGIEGTVKSDILVCKPSVLRKFAHGSFDIKTTSFIYKDNQRALWEGPIANVQFDASFDEPMGDGRSIFGCEIGYETGQLPPVQRWYGYIGYSNTIHDFPYGVGLGVGTSGSYRRSLVDISFEIKAPDSWYPHALKIQGKGSVTNLLSSWNLGASWSRPLGVVFKRSRQAFLSGCIKDYTNHTRVQGERFIVALGSFRTLTDTMGRYSFAGIPPGIYALKVDATTPHWIGVPRPIEMISLSSREKCIEDLVVAKPSEISGTIELFSRREGVVMSTVKGIRQDENFLYEGPLCDAIVVATPLAGGHPIFARTRSDGTFQFYPIYPGRWKVALLSESLPSDSMSSAVQGIILECVEGEKQEIAWRVYPKKKTVRMIN